MHEVSLMESTVKRVISAQYKDLFGKGPEETSVYMSDNVMTIKFSGVLTRIEETLNRMDQGNVLVREIRESIINIAREQHLPALEKITGKRIEHMSYYFSEPTNHMYLFLVLEEGN